MDSVSRICEWCQAEYFAKVTWQRYCDADCLKRARAKIRSDKWYATRVVTTKTCSVCGTEFNTYGRKKLCSAACRALYHRPSIIKAGRDWKDRNKDKNNRISRNSQLRRIYGITLKQYEEMAAAQGNVCFLCGRTNGDGKNLAVDHCHTTGKIRGLLCKYCNSAIGFLQDDPNLVARVYWYLVNSKGGDYK